MDTILDHVDRAVGRLLAQFREKPKLEGLVRALVSEAQTLEGVMQSLSRVRSIDDAEGVQLDLIGRIVGREREGMLDADYRLWLKAQIALSLSSGTPDEILTIFRLLFPDSDVELEEQYPAAFVMRVGGAFPGSVPQVMKLLLSAKPVAVRVLMESSDVPDDAAFTLSDDDTSMDDDDRGFGDDQDPDIGGKLADVNG